MAKVVNKPTLELDTHEMFALSKTVSLLKEIAENEEMHEWYENNVDQNLMDTIENLEILFDNATLD